MIYPWGKNHRDKAKRAPSLDIPKQVVTRMQVFTLIMVAYVIVDMVLANHFKAYLFNDGILVFLFLYVLPAIAVLAVYLACMLVIFKHKSTGIHGGRERKHASKEMDMFTSFFFPMGVRSLKMPLELRPELAKIHGDLIAGRQEETLPVIEQYISTRAPRKIITCGDVISKNFLKMQELPDIMVVDGKTCRKEYKLDVPGEYQAIDIENPTGSISREAWFAIKNAFFVHRKLLIRIVKGEEDLLVLPLVLLAPVGSIVSYGQPPVTDTNPPIPSGAVMIPVSRNRKKHFFDVLSRFERVR
ncbi:DUF359 domain-containing protein [Candidatus Bathyarchaeota archaeon]|nr:DUF359 domain-containing protein [Candidatus Bathyarchaeota archaeon]